MDCELATVKRGTANVAELCGPAPERLLRPAGGLQAPSLRAGRRTDLLTFEQHLQFMDLIEFLATVKTPDAFMSGLRNAMSDLLPYETIICGIARMMKTGLKPDYMLQLNFPKAYLDMIRGNTDVMESYAFQAWRTTRIRIAINFDEPNRQWPADMFQVAWDLDFRNLLCHGQVDIEGNFTSYFSFHRISERVGPKHCYVLRSVAPHLHVTLMRLREQHESAQPEIAIRAPIESDLTAFQMEILYWLQRGKTNWEISSILGTSVNNIKYHLKKINTKLRVTNRVEAALKTADLAVG